MTSKELIEKFRREIEMLDGMGYPCDNSEQEVGYHLALYEVGRFLDTLSVEEKPTNLEQELEKWRHEHFGGERDGHYSGEYLERSSQIDLARHFYELGQNAK